MGMSQSRNFAPTVVVVSSLVAYFKIPKTRIYARAAYRLYILTGMLHFVASYFGFEDSLQTPLEIAFTWSYALGLPLLAAEVCCVNGVFSGIATLHILVPTATLIIYHYDASQLDVYLLGVSHGYSMLAMIACGILTNRITPYGVTLAYYFTLYKVDPKTAIDPTFLETWCTLVAIGNIFSIIEFS